MTNNETLEKIASISSRLEAHLQVAEFVDKTSGEEIKRLFKQQKELTDRVSSVETSLTDRISAVETSIIILKNEKNTKKEYFLSLLKVIGLICVIIGSIYTLTKLGIINGVSPN